MNLNFNGALKLYEYVTAYTKDGYEVREERRQISPFLPDVADEFSEIIWLSSFLTYEYGSEIREHLRDAYQKEELLRNEKEIERRNEKLALLKRKIKESGGSTDEYLLLLEEQIRALEAENRRLVFARDLVVTLKQEIAQLETDKKNLFAQIERLTEEMEQQAQEYEQKLADLRAEMEQQAQEYEQKLADLRAEMEQRLADLRAEMEQQALAYEQKLADLRAEMEQQARDYEQKLADLRAEMAQQAQDYEQKLVDLRAEMQAAMDQMEADYNLKLDEARKAHEKTIAEYNEQIRNLKEAQALEMKAQMEKYKALNAQLETSKQETLLVEAKILALRVENNLISPEEDFTKQEQFEQLEKQYQVFKKFFKEEWVKTKRSIRQNSFGAFLKAIRENREKEFFSAETSQETIPGQPAESQKTEDVSAPLTEDPQAKETPVSKAEDSQTLKEAPASTNDPEPEQTNPEQEKEETNI